MIRTFQVFIYFFIFLFLFIFFFINEGLVLYKGLKPRVYILTNRLQSENENSIFKNQ